MTSKNKPGVKGYRNLVIKESIPRAQGICITLHGSCISLELTHKWLRSKNIDATNLTVGREIYIKGVYGNGDADLARISPLDDLRLA